MPASIHKKISCLTALLLLISMVGFLTSGLAQDLNEDTQKVLPPRERPMPKNEPSDAYIDSGQVLTELQKDARQYRNQGFELQGKGKLDEAMGLYQKAIAMDPSYVVVYNDLGVIYEAKGMAEKAEELYLKAIKLDPYYLSTYSNLAFLYENKGELAEASFYWSKRINMAQELGLEFDPWVEKAKQRLSEISILQGGDNEYHLLSFMKEVARSKEAQRRSNKELSKSYFEEARTSFAKGDYATAIKKAIDAQQLDPANPEITDFIDKSQIRVLSK